MSSQLIKDSETGTRYIDNLGRIWEVKKAWDTDKTGYLVGITKDTPTFTAEQLRGIYIDGLRRKEDGAGNQ